MERLLMFLMICVFAKAMENRKHTKIVRAFEDYERSDPVPHTVRKVPCSSSLDNERNTLTEEAQCVPKKILYSLRHVPRAAYEEIYPEALWIKQCVGICSQKCSICKPEKTKKRPMPVRIVNHKTSKEACATHTVEEHVSCQCTAVGRSKTGLRKYGKSKLAVEL